MHIGTDMIKEKGTQSGGGREIQSDWVRGGGGERGR